MKRLLVIIFLGLSFAATAQTQSGSDTLTAKATILGGDGTGRVVSYIWSAQGPAASIFDNPNSVTTKFTVNTPGSYVVSVTVTDDKGNVAKNSVTIPAYMVQGVSVSASASSGGIIIK